MDKKTAEYIIFECVYTALCEYPKINRISTYKDKRIDIGLYTADGIIDATIKLKFKKVNK